MRRIFVAGLALTVMAAIASAAGAQIRTQTQAHPAGPFQYQPVNKIFDYWKTSGGTHVTVDIPNGFFGPTSIGEEYTIDCVGVPFGRSAGHGLSANADTSVRRVSDPNLPNIGDTTTVSIKMHGLSLESINPISVDYGNGSPTELWDVHVGLSTVAPQPWGSLTATKTWSGGGTFSSSLTVIPRFSFTRISDGQIVHLDVGVPSWGVPASTIQATNGHYVKNLPGFSGNFHPGYSPGPTPEPFNYYEFSNNCAEHETEPCGEDCPDDDPDLEPVDEEPVEPFEPIVHGAN
ncbi:MAG: hypothetical protein AAF481_06545 [Acidobacteriota bacterium]